MKNNFLKVLNSILIFIAIIISLYFVVFRDNKIGLVLKDLSIVITMFLPFLIEKLFKKKINIITKTYYTMFVFIAHFLGATCELYKYLYFFDKITHFISGILSSYFAILLLKHFKEHDEMDKTFNFLFMIAITFMIAGLWEIFEFYANMFFGGDAQRVVDTGVTDTMIDIIVAFLGSVLYCILYFKRVKKRIK